MVNNTDFTQNGTKMGKNFLKVTIMKENKMVIGLNGTKMGKNTMNGL